MKIKTVNPATEEIINEYETHSEKEIYQFIEKAELIYRKWRKKKIPERLVFVKNLSSLLREKKDELARFIAIEMGKPIIESKSEIEKCAYLCDYFYEHSEEFLQDEDRSSWANSSKKNIIAYEPTGTILAIMPWNFPFWQVFRCAIPAIIAGNTVILKHAPNVSGISLVLEKLFLEAGFPDYVFQSILIHNENATEITNLILSHPQITGVSVTGSVKTGKIVAQIAGKYLKKSVMELGGLDPFIVLPDANIQIAAEVASLARCQNSGQSCIAAKRFLLHDSIYDSFKKIFVEKMQDYAKYTGNPLNEQTRIGPLARKDLREDLAKLVDDAKNKDACIIMGGSYDKNQKGFFYEVTIIENITNDMDIYAKETFGPVASLYKYSSMEEAIQLANDTPYGLGASIWTENSENLKEFITELNFGNVFVNSLVKSDPALPFGGIKESGYGKELSREGIREFVNTKLIRIF